MNELMDWSRWTENACTDWNGAAMQDAEEPRVTPTCGELRAMDAEISRLRETQRVLVEALRKIDAATFSHVDGRDLFAQMHPRNMLDIKRRIDARETWFEGDWLTDLWSAIKEARAVLASIEEQPFYQTVPADEEVTAPAPLTCWGLSSFCAETGHKCRAAGACVYAPPAPEQQEPSEDARVRAVALSLDELQGVIELLRIDHRVDDFEPECPSCTARVKLEAAMQEPKP